MDNQGYFVVSLDFELLWGVHDHETKSSFLEKVEGARAVVPVLLELFDEYKIHATWGIVGMLMAESKEELLAFAPTEKPTYEDQKLSAYSYFDVVGNNEQDDVFHYAGSLVRLIGSYENQEVASHTFSHYYCKAEGQSVEQFADDLDSAQRITAKRTGESATSLIFPRNHFTEEYAKVAATKGFTCVRGNPRSFAYDGKSIRSRVVRLLDTYVNVCGMKCASLEDCRRDSYVNIPASRFFRKYNQTLRMLEGAKIACIKRQMRYAARYGKVFHLWWHPHNISINTEKSIEQLRELFEYYKELNEKYHIQSMTMREMAGVACVS